MSRRLLLVLCSFALPFYLYAGGKIKYYFNHPVDNSVSTGVNAIYLNGTVDDTLISYINRAKYTIDVAVYNTTSSATNVMNAINAAYARNVKVRWIFDSSYQVESELNTLNSGINKLGRPDNNNGYIMHNKFMIVDANSTDPNDAIVWTGSSNWNSPQFGSDYNNIVIIQDQAVARAYRAHFNMMWGDTGIAPNNSLSKFGASKTDLGNHIFTVDGNLVELYFSPKDGTNSHIQSVINSANVDIYFGMFTFTDNTDASLLVSKKSSGIYVAGIQDQSSSSSSAASTLSSGLGGFYKVYNSSNSYHNKFVIVDPSDKCSDPTVLTGSHNWSFTANTQNDENTLIIHDDTAANIYYQSFRRDFTGLGGTLAIQNGCTTSVTDHNSIDNSVQIIPNPSAGNFSISFDLASPQHVRIEIINAVGQRVTVFDEEERAGWSTIKQNIASPGIYFVKFTVGAESFAKKVVIN